MKVLNYRQLDLAEELFNHSNNSMLETKYSLPKNTFLDKLKIHKLLIDQNQDKLGLLDKITEQLVKNSNLNIGDDEKTITLLCVSAFSASQLDSKFVIDNKVNKGEFEKEIQSVLEELKMIGVGNNIVKNLSNCFKSILKLSKSIESILSFVTEHKVGLTDLEAITNYIKNRKFINKDNSVPAKIMTINEFNF
jgi:hypothetical protein